MPDYLSPNSQNTFGRELTKYITSRLPYTSYSLIDRVSELNPKYTIFRGDGSNLQQSLIDKSIASNIVYDEPAANVSRNKEFFDYMYANVSPDKGKRLGEYRVMAAFSEVSDALDEICDEMINPDANGDIMHIKFPNCKLKSHDLDDIREEFRQYIGYFKLQTKGWEYFRQMIVDAEVYFEHIIHKDFPEKGVLGILPIPTDLIDPIYTNTQNQLVKGYLLRKLIYDATNPKKVIEEKMIPLDVNQVTYINSGIWNESKTVRLPFIENARRAYRQLSLIEDAIVIYRLVRAPEKLVFNVDVGNMPPPKAESYLRKLMQQYWSKRTFDTGSESGTVNKFNPQSMLDSFWFAKRAGSEGTSVTQLAGGQNLGEITDLLYFTKKLYKSLKVPTTRVNPEDTFNDGENVLREELKFARFVIRQQQRFAGALKPGFITHLKLKKLWKKYDFREDQIEFELNVPTNFYELREQQKLQLKFTSYSNLSQTELISKTYAQKKYLGWTDSDILANRAFLRKDTEFLWEIEQIKAGGPNWKESATAAANAGGAEAALGGGAGAPPGASGVPPAFGPTPTDGGGAETPPEGGEAEAEGETAPAAPAAPGGEIV